MWARGLAPPRRGVTAPAASKAAASTFRHAHEGPGGKHTPGLVMDALPQVVLVPDSGELPELVRPSQHRRARTATAVSVLQGSTPSRVTELGWKRGRNADMIQTVI